MRQRLFWLGVALCALAGVAAALVGVWWAAVADLVIVVGLIAAQRRAEHHLRQAEQELRRAQRPIVNGDGG